MLERKHLKMYSKKIWLLPLLLAVGPLSGCFVFDFFSQRYENSVAYFNTYYNATRLFDDAVLEIQTTERSQRSKGLPPQKEISQTAKQKLTSVIEKCSKLLQYHPTSKWVDDALMLIGKSYYYMGEYMKADRKFAELIAQFPESERVLEARLWLGKSLRRSNELDPATRELSGVADAATAASEKSIAAQAYLELGEIYTEKEANSDAVKAYQDLINKSDYDELKAEAQFRLAQLNEKAGDYQKAADAFRKVADFNPDLYLRYQSSLRYAINMERLGNHDEALRVLYALLDDRSFADFFPQIKLQIADVLSKAGDTESAIEAYSVIDTTYRRTDVAAKAFYRLGLLYEKALHNYAAAETNYVRASLEYTTSDVAPLGRERGGNLKKYHLARRMITAFDSSIVTEMARLQKGRDTVEVQQPDTLTVGQPDTKTAEETHSLGDSLASKLHPPWQLHTELWDTTATSATIRALKLQLAKQTYDLAVLFFLDLDEPDSALYWCERTVNLSADSELSARALYTLAEIHRTINPSNQADVDSLYNRIISDYPTSSYGKEAQRILGVGIKKTDGDSAASAYRHAEVLLEDKRTDEAIGVLRTIVQQYPTSPYSPKSQYAIGWIYENVDDNPDSAARNYKTLANLYPTSTYANAVMPKLIARDQWESQSKLKLDSMSTDSLQHKKETGVLPDSLPTVTALRDSIANADTLKQATTSPKQEFNDELNRRFRRMRADTTIKVPD
jgi:TolA-binding protein